MRVGHRCQELFDIAPKPDRIPDGQARKASPDVPASFEIMGVMSQDVQELAAPRNRQPQMFLQVVMTERPQELGIDNGTFVIREVRTLVIVAQRRPQGVFGQVVVIEEHRLGVVTATCGFFNRSVQLGLTENSTAHQKVEDVLFDGRTKTFHASSAFLQAASRRSIRAKSPTETRAYSIEALISVFQLPGRRRSIDDGKPPKKSFTEIGVIPNFQ